MPQITETPSTRRSVPAPAALDLVAVKARQQATWASGDYAVIGTTLQLVGEALCEAADLAAGSRVLDVACGNGNASLAAARRFCRTTGLDYVPELLARARERAAAERQPIEFVEGDAENLPFADESFDAVLSTFGVMFTANQARAAEELARVTVPGGKIALACWTPEGFLGDLFRTVGRLNPPPAGLGSPFRWGSRDGLESLFGESARLERVEAKEFVFRYFSASHFVEVFRSVYGPTHKAFAALDEQGKNELEADLLSLLSRHNQGGSASLKIPGEYLEVVLERR